MSHDPEAPVTLRTPGLGESQRRLLVRLKREGESTLGELSAALELSPETIREHLSALAARGLVERAGARRRGPGRPEILYRLTGQAETLFPQRDGALLRELAAYLIETDRQELLRDFFERRVSRRREAALRRLAGLRGADRLREVAALLSEEGFMAEVREEAGGDGPTLRLCHCPLRQLVEVSDLPCRAEIAFVQELLGEELRRIRYMPDGDDSCTYRSREPAATP